MSKRERRTFKPDFKSKIALEAIKGLQPISEIASKYKLHPNQIVQWKNQLVQDAALLFSKGSNANNSEDSELTAKLYEEIGRLKMELRWLEKKL